MYKLSEPKKSKSVASSGTGMAMDTLISKMKMHKAHKGMNDCLGKMHGAIAGVPKEDGKVKLAYLAGYKYAEESIQSDDSSGKDNTEKATNEPDHIIKTLRRGWPDLTNENKKDEVNLGQKVEDTYDPDSSLDVAREKAKMTPHSPDTTV